LLLIDASDSGGTAAVPTAAPFVFCTGYQQLDDHRRFFVCADRPQARRDHPSGSRITAAEFGGLTDRANALGDSVRGFALGTRSNF
jgi:hypothetical protein